MGYAGCGCETTDINERDGAISIAFLPNPIFLPKLYTKNGFSGNEDGCNFLGEMSITGQKPELLAQQTKVEASGSRA